jgi:hypothetical protein
MLKRFKRIYVSGCSLTAGSGLDSNDVKERYKELHNIEYGHEKELTYPKYLGEFFDCPVINDAKSGTGSPRLIRRVYEFIQEIGFEEAKNTLFFLQVNNAAHRAEMYYKKIGDYLVINPKYDLGTGELKALDCTDNWSGTDRMYDAREYEDVAKYLKNHFDKFHDPFIYEDKISDEFVGLISFLESLNIEYYYTIEFFSIQDRYRMDIYNKLNTKRLIKPGGEWGISPYTTNLKLNICDDTNFIVTDSHPGILGHKSLGEELCKILKEKLTQTLWVFGDSFSVNFETLSMSYKPFEDYINLKGYIPKNYIDHLSNEYGYKVRNFAKAGVSNASIFNQFINVMNDIQPEDIIIINWTSILRHRVSDGNNNFWDVSSENSIDCLEGSMSENTLNEIKLNRNRDYTFYKEMLEYVTAINKICENNFIIHWDWELPAQVDNTTINILKNKMLSLKNFQTIREETGNTIVDYHYSELGHLELAEFFKKEIKKKYNTKKESIMDRIKRKLF